MKCKHKWQDVGSGAGYSNSWCSLCGILRKATAHSKTMWFSEATWSYSYYKPSCDKTTEGNK